MILFRPFGPTGFETLVLIDASPHQHLVAGTLQPLAHTIRAAFHPKWSAEDSNREDAYADNESVARECAEVRREHKVHRSPAKPKVRRPNDTPGQPPELNP